MHHLLNQKIKNPFFFHLEKFGIIFHDRFSHTVGLHGMFCHPYHFLKEI